MKRCIYHGYSFQHSAIKHMDETAKVALDAVRHSSIQEYPDELSSDDIGNMIVAVFMREHPDFNLVCGMLEFLN